MRIKRMTVSWIVLSVMALTSGCATRQQMNNAGAAASDRPQYAFTSQPDQWLDVAALPTEAAAKYSEQFPQCVASGNRLVNAIAREQASAAQNAAAGALAGAILGALIMPRGYRNYGATHGAVAGGLSAGVQTIHNNAAAAERRFNQALSVCLRNAGFALLRSE